ncbi:MAG: acyl-CoA dehydrogenase family protein [Nitrososphaerales archaeon]
MVSFELSKEERDVENLARAFRQNVVEKDLKKSDEYDKADPIDRFPWQIVRESSKLGLRTLSVGKEFGGLGADAVSLCIAEKELAYGDMGVGVIFAQVWKIALALERGANDQQKNRFLKKFMNDPEMVLSIAGTEESGGSDIWIPYNHPDAGVKMTAALAGGEWILNGKKSFISNAPQSKIYIVLARTDTSKGTYDGTSLFIVEKDTPGVSIGRIFDKLGEKFTSNSEIIFTNAKIPKENILSEVNQGYSHMLSFYAVSNPLAGATALGNALRAYDTALEYAKSRVVGGKPMMDHEAIGIEFADMHMKLQAAYDLILEAAWSYEHQSSYDPKLGWMSKIFASEVGFEVCRKSLEMQAHSGIIVGSRAEKCLRDATIFLHSDGANLALKVKIWNDMRGLKYIPA